MKSGFVRAASLCALLVSSGITNAIPVSEISSTKPGKVIDLGGLKPFKKATKVVVPGYRVGFIMRDKVHAHSEGLLRGGASNANMEAFLSGVDYATMQAAADDAYAAFLDKLKSSGMEVVPLDKLKAAPSFGQFEATASTASAPYTGKIGESRMVVLSPTGIPLWFNSTEKFVGGSGNFSGNNNKVVAKLAEETGAVAIFPMLLLDFTAAEGSGNKMLTNRASVSMQARTRVVPNSWFWSSDSKGGAFGKFLDGVRVEGDCGSLDEASASDDAAFQKGLDAFGMGGAATSKKVVVLHTDNAKYKGCAVGALNGASDVFVKGIDEVRK